MAPNPRNATVVIVREFRGTNNGRHKTHRPPATPLPLGRSRTDHSSMRLRLTLEGMLAVHAKRAVFTALAGVPGVTSAEVELGRATIDCEPQVSEAALRAALDTVGVRLTASVRELPTL